jgi:hypothetical protein
MFGIGLLSSLPGLTRQSIALRRVLLMDARVKPGHDDSAECSRLPQRRQQAFSRFEVGRFRALRELLEDRQQQRARVVGASLAGP